MRASTLFSLLRSGGLGAVYSAQKLIASFERCVFLGSASSAHLLRRLAKGPVEFKALAAELCADASMHDALRDWLEVGVGLGDLSRDGELYSLGSRLARTLADPDSDALAAFLEEAASLHHRLLWEGPRRMKEGRPLALSDQDGAVIAGSSRLLEPFVGDEVDAFVPGQGALRLLEIGCGTGVHVRRALSRNPALSVTALELQPEVAELARRNLAQWGLAERAQVQVGDVRARQPEPAYDLATLHNNIYYFPVAQRVSLLRHVSGFLRPGGRLLLTTGCRGGGAAMSVLSLWGALTEGAGRLPGVEELESQLRDAGFARATSKQLMPGEAFYAFMAERS
ncbi:MAG: class I SAM-dependent methyltransferase [Myxococcales bacterium]